MKAPIKRLVLQTLTGVLIGFALLGVFILYAESRSSDAPSGPQSTLREGQPAPNFEVQTLDGKQLKLADLRGAPVWLNFWAESCAPCRAEMPELLSVGKEAQARGVRLLALNVGEAPERVSGYLGRAGLDGLPVALDRLGRASTAYKVYYMPTHVFIDAKGRIHEVQVGKLSADGMRKALRGLE